MESIRKGYAEGIGIDPSGLTNAYLSKVASALSKSSKPTSGYATDESETAKNAKNAKNGVQRKNAKNVTIF